MQESIHDGYEPTAQQRENGSIRLTARIILFGTASLGLLWGLYTLRIILLLLLLSLLLSYLLEPVVYAFETGRLRCGRLRVPLPRLPRLLTICLVYLLGLAVIIALSMIFLPIALKEGGSLIQNVPTYVDFIQETTAHLAALYDRYNLPTAWQPMVNTSLAKGAQALLHILETIVSELTTALSNAWWLFIPPLLAFFLLKDSGRLWIGFLTLLPHPARRQRVAEMLTTIEEVLATFIRTQLVLCVLMGLWIIVLLTMLGIPYSFLLGLLAAVLEFVPVFGPLFAGALICLIAAVRDPLLALWVLLALTFIRAVQDYIIVPRVMGQHIQLHPAVIIVAVLCGAELAGIAGVFLATPVAAIVKVLLLTWQRSRFAADEISTSYPDDVPSA
jgi:predicted PurR-regulated permease PerM